jgi:hypothetical protein
MFKVFAGRLHCVNHVRGSEPLAVAPCHSNEQALHQRELGYQSRALPRSRRGTGDLIAAKWKLAPEYEVHQVVLQDVRVSGKKWRIVALVRQVEVGGKRLKAGAGTVADAGLERFNALHKTRQQIRTVQQHPRKPQHRIQLRRAVKRKRIHRNLETPRSNRGLKTAQEFCNGALHLTRIETAAQDAQKKQPLPERVSAIRDQCHRGVAREQPRRPACVMVPFHRRASQQVRIQKHKPRGFRA